MSPYYIDLTIYMETPDHHFKQEDPDDHKAVLVNPRIDLFCDPKWQIAKTAFPFKAPTRLYCITISPPSEVEYDIVYDIRDRVQDFFTSKEIPCIFVAEITRAGRLHWHGIADIGSRVRVNGRYDIKDSYDVRLRDLLLGLSFIDVSRVNNLTNWLMYMTKEVHALRRTRFEPIGHTAKTGDEKFYLQIPRYNHPFWHYADMEMIHERFQVDNTVVVQTLRDELGHI